MTADTDTPLGDDPFERAIARERAYRTQRSRLQIAPRVFVALAGIGLAWGVLVALHWAFFSEPRWLAIAHTMVFGFKVVMSVGAALFFRATTKGTGGLGFSEAE